MCKPKFGADQMMRWLDGVKKWGNAWRMACWAPKKHAGTRKQNCMTMLMPWLLHI